MTVQFEETEVVPARAPLVPVILAVIGFGLVIGGAVLVYLLGFFGATPESGVCKELIPSCATVSVAQVEELAGVDLPAGTTVVRGFLGEREGAEVLDAVLQLPAGVVPEIPNTYTVSFEGSEFEVSALGSGLIWTGGTDDGLVGYQLLVSDDEPRTVTIGISKTS